MSLKNLQIENLHSYIIPIYQKQLNDLESDRIKALRESDEYVETFNKIKSFYNTELNLEPSEYELCELTERTLRINIWESRINSYTTTNNIYIKVKAILSTLSDDLTFEEIIKIVDEKLNFYSLIN